jgi:hypothetical protein
MAIRLTHEQARAIEGVRTMAHQQARAVEIALMRRLPGKATPRRRRMNKLEERYSVLLDARKVTGEIHRWDFEPEKFRLADNTFYTPDFRLVLRDYTVEFHEVKGFMRDDAMVKIKVAAELHPYKFVLVRCTKGQWSTEEI